MERSYANPVNSALVGPFGEHTDPVQVAVFELHAVLVEEVVSTEVVTPGVTQLAGSQASTSPRPLDFCVT